MNRKDFEIIGRAVKSAWPGAYPDYGNAARNHIAAHMATAIEAADGCSGFDREKFLKACGVSNVTL